jgi:DNA polymerase-3 subunit beta
MDITIARNALSAILARASSVANPKNVSTVLRCVVLDASDGRLIARATDLLVGVETVARAAVKTPGTVMVDAKRIAEVAKNMPAGDVRLRIVKSQLEASGGRSKMKLGIFPPEEFPVIDTGRNATAVAKLPGNELARLINQTQFAIEQDDQRASAALQLISDGTRVSAFASDGKRVANSQAAAPGIHCTLLIPSKSVREVKALAESAKDAEVTISHGGGYAYFALSLIHI